MINDDHLKAAVDHALTSFERKGVRRLKFADPLEAHFERNTRESRSHRMWLKGVIAIAGFNLCLLVDYLFVRNGAGLSILQRTVMVTPVAVAANLIVRKNPAGPIREGSVAVAMIAIGLINMYAEGNSSPASALFGVICLLICALFLGVVMRLRFLYVLVSVLTLWAMSLWSFGHAHNPQPAEAVLGGSMVSVALGIILIASHSLEREERRGYLLGLQRDLHAMDLMVANQVLRQLSRLDELTDLPNRRALEEYVAVQWKACADAGVPLSAVVVDLDHFKKINDIQGHLYGDETLRRVGALLPKALRSPSDMAARCGGDEFVLLLPQTGDALARLVGERTRELVEAAGTPPKQNTPGAPVMWTTVSCGVATCVPSPESEWTELLAAADQALYNAKRSGRNRVEFVSCQTARPPARTGLTLFNMPAAASVSCAD